MQEITFCLQEIALKCKKLGFYAKIIEKLVNNVLNLFYTKGEFAQWD